MKEKISDVSIREQAEEVAKLLEKAGAAKAQEYYLAGVMAGMQFSAARGAEKESA